MPLKPDQWDRIKEIVADALELPAEKRESFVLNACNGDAALLSEVCSLVPFELHGTSAERGLSGLTPGTVLNNRYCIERALAQGGFATTWLALDQQLLNRRVVVKLLTSTDPDPYIRSKFADELHALSVLEHPNIVAPLDSGITPAGVPFLVMQYAEGRTLREVLSEGPMPLHRASRILAQTGHALSFIHAAGIIHRDVKPENIVIQTFGDSPDHVRLIDFGISSIVTSGDKRTTRIIGSLAYMAPEQLLGKVEPATDIYALGVVAYEMVTDTLPFSAATPSELASLLGKGSYARPSQLRPDLPLAAEALIRQALQSDPARRPNDAGVFGDKLAESLESAPSPAHKASRSVLYAMIAILLVVAGAVFFRFLLTSTPRKSALPAHSDEQTVSVPAVTLEILRHMPAGSVRPAPSGHVNLRNGDEFRILLHNSAPGYLYVFSEDADHRSLHILFPSPTSNNSRSFLGSSQIISIPEQKWFLIDSPPPVNHQKTPATDTIVLVWALSALPEFDSALRFANSRDRGELPETGETSRIRTVLEQQKKPLRFDGSAWLLFSSSSEPFAVGLLRIDHGE